MKKNLVKENISIGNARIGFRNFSGKEGRYNPKGRRNFCVFLDYDLAQRLESDGWNVRWLKPRDEDEESQPYLQVSVSYGAYPPSIYLIASGRKVELSESGLDVLDYAEIQNVDLIIRPYNWEVNEKSGVKAYASKIYITLVEDEFAQKYRNVPDSAISAISNTESGDDSL